MLPSNGAAATAESVLEVENVTCSQNTPDGAGRSRRGRVVHPRAAAAR
jgi:hypothetical protein